MYGMSCFLPLNKGSHNWASKTRTVLAGALYTLIGSVQIYIADILSLNFRTHGLLEIVVIFVVVGFPGTSPYAGLVVVVRNKCAPHSAIAIFGELALHIIYPSCPGSTVFLGTLALQGLRSC